MYIEDRIQNSSLWRIILKIQRFFMVLSTVSVVIMLGIVVTCRYVIKVNILGYDEIILVSAFWMYFIGGSYATYEESHINADILSQFLSSRKMQFIGILGRIVQVLIGFPLVYLAYEMLVFDAQTNPTTVDLSIPLLIPQSAIFFGYFLMTFYSLVYLFRDIHRYKDSKNFSK